METYKIDWKDVVYGTIEIDASDGIEASELFNTLTDHELLEQSEIMRGENCREIRFVTAELVEVHTGDEWEEFWKAYS